MNALGVDVTRAGLRFVEPFGLFDFLRLVAMAPADSGTPRAPGTGALVGRPVRRVWVLSELYYPEDTSTGHVMTQLAEGLAKYYPVLALCSQPTYSARGRRALATEERGGVLIIRCKGTTLDKDRLARRLLNMATLGASMLAQALLRIRRGDVALVVTNPPVLPFLVMLACLLRRARCVLVLHDVYPEALVAAGLLAPGGFSSRVLDRLNHWLYSKVEAVTVVGRDMRALVLRKLQKADDLRVVVVPNWADELRPEPREANGLLKELGLESSFVVQYAGNMGLVHGIESLFEAARQLEGTAPDVHFLFIGSGARKPWLERAVREAGLRNVTILPHRPRADQQVFLNACDVSISALKPGMGGAGVPSRMYNVMAAGKAMIAAVDDDAEQALVIQEETVGWVVPPDSPTHIVEAILDARSDATRLAQMGQRARAAVERKYGLANAVDAYRRIIDREPDESD